MHYRLLIYTLLSTVPFATFGSERFAVQRMSYDGATTISILGHQFGWRADENVKGILRANEIKKLVNRCTGEPITPEQQRVLGKKLLSRNKKNQPLEVIPGTDPRQDPNFYVYHEEGTRLWGKIPYSHTYLFDVSWENDRAANGLRIINKTGEMLYLDPSEKPHKLSYKRTFRALPEDQVRRIVPPRQEFLTLWRKQQNNEPAHKLRVTVRVLHGTRTATLRRRNNLIWADLQEKRRSTNESHTEADEE